MNICHILWIKPFLIRDEWRDAIRNSKFGALVLDDDYEEGVASSIAHRLMLDSKNDVHTLALRHRTAGFHPSVDNLPPSKEEIMIKIKEICNV